MTVDLTEHELHLTYLEMGRALESYAHRSDLPGETLGDIVLNEYVIEDIESVRRKIGDVLGIKTKGL